MIDLLKYGIPIRVRLTLWYVLLLAFTFILFAVYLTIRFQQSLRSGIDSSLHIAVSNTIATFDQEDIVDRDQLMINRADQSQVTNPDFAMRVITPQGEVWDSSGNIQDLSSWGPLQAGYSTQTGTGNVAEWRIFSQPVHDLDGQPYAWVQAAQSLGSVNKAVEDLRIQLFLGIPLVLLFAGLGGYFLANRALRPIRQITQTAQEITARDLSKRLAYRGARDEIGSLATTFDQMLGRLQSSFARERQFTGDAAHELRTPLTILKGQIEVALNRHRSSTAYEKILQELSAQVERLIRLSNGLLFLSRSDQQQLSFQPVELDLCEWLEVLAEQVEPLAQEKGLTINTNIPAGLFVYGDSDHLIRLFLNLLENALKYTPAGGEILITALKAQNTIQVVIHNTGPNISQEYLPHLFERFYRVQEDRSSQTGGAGLGLAIAREIVRLHRGDIKVQSEPGQGVTVTVELPVGRPSVNGKTDR